jgi:outer membrane lipoprotein-sorting protein
MTQITRWFTLIASILAILMLCSCVSSYVPAQSSIQKMSVSEARNIVLQMAKPPVKFISEYAGIYHVVYRADMSTIQEDHYKVYLRTNSIRIIGKQKYEIPFKDIKLVVDGNSVWVYESSGIAGDGHVFHVDRKGFATEPDLQFFTPLGEDSARRLADALSVLKNAAPHLAADEEAHFQEAARNYRASATKPQLLEATRRFKVQAESAIGDKDFNAAADFYEQGLEISPWWPQGHFNRALVLAETGDYEIAIWEMKRYLALLPDAPDARAAQDKIYNWERGAGK